MTKWTLITFNSQAKVVAFAPDGSSSLVVIPQLVGLSVLLVDNDLASFSTTPGNIQALSIQLALDQVVLSCLWREVRLDMLMSNT